MNRLEKVTRDIWYINHENRTWIASVDRHKEHNILWVLDAQQTAYPYIAIETKVDVFS